MTERAFAIQVVRRLREAGFQALWAGGCVRDQLLGLTPKDYDVATDARPEDVQKLFRRTVAVGASFGVVEVLGPRDAKIEDRKKGASGLPLSDPRWLKVQVATFRADVSYSDGRRPDAVVFASAREDALRRDFTINGMFFDPLEDEVADYVGGQEDLQKRVLRAIGNPSERFAEDKLRLLRAVRFATRFDLSFDPVTEAALKAMADQIVVVSAERIAEELRRLLVSPQRARGVRLLDETGLAQAILPEILEMKGLPQGLPNARSGDLWEHVLRVLELLGPEPSFPLAFAALLHDVGKRRTAGRTPDRYTFYSHEHVGRRMAADICLRLKLSNAERERIEWLVEKHQYLSDAPQMRPSKLKMILAHPGIGELLALHRADALAAGRGLEHVEFCEQKLREWSETDLNPPPLLTGDDLEKRGLEPGPIFKRLLDSVREAQLDGSITTPEQAMQLVEKLLKDSEKKHSQTRNQISIRLFVDDPGHVKAAAFAQTVREHVAPFADIIRLENKPYWKIPEWSEVFLIAQPPATMKPASVFNSILSSLGKGWEKHGAGDEDFQWAVWNPKAGCTFCWQLVRWAHVELFPEPQQAH